MDPKQDFPAPQLPWPISIFADEIYEPSAGLEPSLAMLQKLGVDHIDLRMVNGYDSFINASEQDLANAERLFARYGIKIAGVATPLFKCPLRGSTGPAWGNHHSIGPIVSYRHYLDLLPRAFALADRFGTRNIRCFAFWRQHALEEVFHEVVEKLGRAARMAEASGHMLYLENEHNTMAGTGLEQARIIRAVDSPSLVGIYDDGNSGRLGGVPYPDDYEAMRGRIGHVHLKFQRLEVLCGWLSPARARIEQRSGYRPYNIWHQPTAPIKGEIKIGPTTFRIDRSRTFGTATHALFDHYRPLLRALRRDGYRGAFSIDNGWEGYRHRQAQDNVADLEADVKRVVESLRQLIVETWAEPLPAPPAV